MYQYSSISIFVILIYNHLISTSTQVLSYAFIFSSQNDTGNGLKQYGKIPVPNYVEFESTKTYLIMIVRMIKNFQIWFERYYE